MLGWIGLWMALSGLGGLAMLAYPWTFKGVEHS